MMYICCEGTVYILIKRARGSWGVGVGGVEGKYGSMRRDNIEELGGHWIWPTTQQEKGGGWGYIYSES